MDRGRIARLRNRMLATREVWNDPSGLVRKQLGLRETNCVSWQPTPNSLE